MTTTTTAQDAHGNPPLRVLSLFSGIGGLELGLERAGMTTVGQVELDPYCRTILARHWPEVPRHDDVRTAPAWWRSEPRPVVDLVAGGFPCQPFSVAGRRLGLGDGRWGWPWMRDVVAAVRPRWVLVENVPGLLADVEAFGAVLHDLSDLGFDAEWDVVPACSVGAPHARRRLFLVAHADVPGRPPWRGLEPTGTPALRAGRWPAEPDVGRVAYGLPGRVDRVQALGNSAVPAVAERVGRYILDADRRR